MVCKFSFDVVIMAAQVYICFLYPWFLHFSFPQGGLTGAGARITGAFGDVFAKLTFDDEFIEQRQQTKAKPPKMGWKLGNFAKVCSCTEMEY